MARIFSPFTLMTGWWQRLRRLRRLDSDRRNVVIAADEELHCECGVSIFTSKMAIYTFWACQRDFHWIFYCTRRQVCSWSWKGQRMTVANRRQKISDWKSSIAHLSKAWTLDYLLLIKSVAIVRWLIRLILRSSLRRCRPIYVSAWVMHAGIRLI